jgi:hypothetical protein
MARAATITNEVDGTRVAFSRWRNGTLKQTLSRRSFLKESVATGVAIKVSFLVSAAEAQLIQTPPHPGPDWPRNDGKPKYRLDAIAKVTGEKTFTRDYRARDLEGWPKEIAIADQIAI